MSEIPTIKTTAEKLPETVEDLHLLVFDLDRITDPDPLQESAELAAKILCDEAYRTYHPHPFAVVFVVRGRQVVEEDDRPIVFHWEDLFQKAIESYVHSVNDHIEVTSNFCNSPNQRRRIIIVEDTDGVTRLVIIIRDIGHHGLEVFASSYGLDQHT